MEEFSPSTELSPRASKLPESIHIHGYDRIELDIGSGAGHFLEWIAIANPCTLHIGIEIDPERHFKATKRLRRSGIHNALSIHHEAYSFIRDHVSSASVDNIHIYFPNPHPEHDGQLNRLVDKNFVNELNRIIKDGGCLRLATDSLDYFTDIVDTLKATYWWPVPWLPLPVETACDSLRIGTPCEIKYRVREHRPIYYLQAIPL